MPNSRLSLFKWSLIATIILLICLLLGGLYFWKGPAGTEERIVLIPMKSGSAAIAHQLETARVVRNALIFRYYTILSGQARKLKAGEYAFSPGATLQQVVEKLVSGEVISHVVTIPEGCTASQIAKKLEIAGLVAADDFLQVAHNKVLAKAWGLPGPGLEGFLFPDTYQFTKGMSAEELAKRMVDRFREKVGTELIAAGKIQGLNLLQLITLASIIEREVRAPQERAMVASVFYNRLRQGKRLESCATVLYSQGRTSGTLSLEDLEFSSPYNTYRHRGLPPGPIGNPGLAAIQAAAYPANTDYLFFVVRPDGTHVFSKDFAAHKRAKWQQKRAYQRSRTVPAEKPKP